MYLQSISTGFSSSCSFSGGQKAFFIFWAMASLSSWIVMFPLGSLLDILLSTGSILFPPFRPGSRGVWSAMGFLQPSLSAASRASMCALLWSRPAYARSTSRQNMSVAWRIG